MLRKTLIKQAGFGGSGNIYTAFLFLFSHLCNAYVLIFSGKINIIKYKNPIAIAEL